MRVPLVDLQAQYARIESEINSVIRGVVTSGRFVGGPEVEAFEREFACFVQSAHAVGVSSGTSALHLALIAAGVGPGDEVILPTHTFIATAEVVRRCGARVRFAEIERDTFTLDPDLLPQALTPRVRAIIPVHIYGHPARMDSILGFAQTHGLRVIEDAAQAHGARLKDQRCGGIASLSAFSFYPGKNLGAYGEGGMVVARDGAEADRMRRLADHGRQDKYLHAEEGYNYRLDAMQAAILRVKLRHLDQWNAERRRAASGYGERLAGLSAVRTPRVAPWAEHVFHLYVIRVAERDRVLRGLREAGIEAGIHYPVPLHLQPAYRYLGYGSGDFPVTEEMANSILSLPLFPEIAEPQLDYVVETLRSLV
jgi:dTDP-4-amino-4,6-dideoxygalactose transaminase